MQLYPPITNYSFPGKIHIIWPLNGFASIYGCLEDGKYCAGHGTCGPPRKRGEFIDVTCHGPEQRLYPGQVILTPFLSLLIALSGLHILDISVLAWSLDAIRAKQVFKACDEGWAIGSRTECTPVQVDNAIMVLASPYPKHGLVEVINQTAQIVTGEGKPVPLSEVCASIWIAQLC